MWSLAACFPWLVAGLSRWPLSMREGRGISDQRHDDDDERGARDSDLFAGARGSGQGPAIGRVCRPQTRHVLNISRMSAVLLFTMTRIRSYGPANLVSCRLASRACDWTG